jgi:hypothetical protein
MSIELCPNCIFSFILTHLNYSKRKLRHVDLPSANINESTDYFYPLIRFSQIIRKYGSSSAIKCVLTENHESKQSNKDEISKHSIIIPYYNSIQNHQGNKLCLFHQLQCKQEICKNHHMEQNNILLRFKLFFF